MPKKILICYFGHSGAGPLFSYHLTKSLAARTDTKIMVVLSSKISQKQDWLSLHNVLLNFYDFPHSVKELAHLPQVFDLIRKLTSDVAKFSPEYVIFPMISPLNYFVATKLRKVCGKSTRFISIIHDPKPHAGERLWVRVLQKLELKFPDAFVTLSEYSKELLRSRTSKPILTVMHPVLEFGTNPRYIASSTVLDHQKIIGKFLFLFYGRIEPYKGLEYLVEAFKKLRSERGDVYLVVAGKGKVSPKLAKEIDKLTLEGTAEFINRYLSEEELYSLINLSDVIVMPYIEATQSGVIAQVVPFGKPVITTCIDGLVEQSFFGQLAMLVPPKNSFFLYLAMRKFCENSDALRKRFAENVLVGYKIPTFDELASCILNFAENL